MSLFSHLQSLNAKHDELEQKIHDAYMHHLPVSELKKEKLKIKEEIQRLNREESSYSSNDVIAA